MKNDQGAAQSTTELLPVVRADRDREAAWLVEFPPNGDLYKGGERVGPATPTQYYCAVWRNGRLLSRTEDPNEAMRFSRQQDAMAMIERLNDDSQFRRFGAIKAFATEHMWVALTTTPQPTDPAGASEMAQVPVCRSCGEPSPNGDPCETCVECERILAMSDEEVVAEAGPEGMAWARGFKEGLRAGRSGRTPPVLEVAKEALEPFGAGVASIAWRGLTAAQRRVLVDVGRGDFSQEPSRVLHSLQDAGLVELQGSWGSGDAPSSGGFFLTDAGQLVFDAGIALQTIGVGQ